MPVRLGDTFLMETPPNGMHLFVIVAGPDSNNCYLCVNITSCEIHVEYEDEDRSCILLPGCHEFITSPSRANYADAVCYEENVILYELKRKGFKQKTSVNTGVLKKLQNGLLISDSLPGKYRRFISTINI